jgi:hypothetical protein
MRGKRDSMTLRQALSVHRGPAVCDSTVHIADMAVGIRWLCRNVRAADAGVCIPRSQSARAFSRFGHVFD